MTHSMEFSRKIALVTGGATGIGQATSMALAARGATVVIVGRRSDVGNEVMEEIRARGGKAEFCCADVTDPLALTTVHTDIIERYGRLDIAFNNAGYQESRALLTEQTDEVFDRVFETNLKAVFHCLQHQISAMSATGGGAIIVNASVSGLRNPNPGLSLYSASKAAVISLAKSAAMEAAEAGVRINIIAPGRVATDMMLGSGIMDMKAVAEGLPIRRLGKPEEVAEAVVWLASDAASFILGHVLCADGGFMTL